MPYPHQQGSPMFDGAEAFEAYLEDRDRSPYCQHDDQTEYKPDGTYLEGFYVYCPACGHEWHVTHEQRFGKPEPVARKPDPDDIAF